MTLMTFQKNADPVHTFAHNPVFIKRVKKKKRVASIATLESRAIFDWGILTDEEGVVRYHVIMRWPMMTKTEFDLLRGFYETTITDSIEWDPQEKAHSVGKTYNVQLTRLQSMEMMQNDTHKTGIILELDITGVV